MPAEHYVKARSWSGMIFDHQDDRDGKEFQKMASWWPSHVPLPAFGVKSDHKTTFATKITKEASNETVYAYPLDTPEDALASAYYFYRSGLPSIGAIDKQAARQVEETILSALYIHGLSMPDGYKVACFEDLSEDISNHRHEVFAWDGLPVTTPPQTMESCKVFDQYQDRYPHSAQIKIAHRLKAACGKHGLTWDHELAKWMDIDKVEISKTASWALDARRKIARDLDHPAVPIYLNELDRIEAEIQVTHTFSGATKIAQRLEEADLLVRMDAAWDQHIFDPSDTLVKVARIDPRETLKQASSRYEKSHKTDWSKLDFDKIEQNNVLVGPAASALRKNANAVVERLPKELQVVLERYLTA